MSTPPEPPPPQPPPPPSQPSPPGSAAPMALRPEEQVRVAYRHRHETDTIFTGPALNCCLVVITCGIFGFYLLYKLMERMREHNRRRLELLDGATTLAWQRANDQGIGEELRPAFERIAGHLEPLRRQASEFREPAGWLGIALAVTVLTSFGFVVFMIAFYLLDSDLFRHDTNEGAIEAELSEIYRRLGQTVAAPDPFRVQGRHNYAARIIVSIVTFGIYGLWWLYDMQLGPNRHFEINWAWEDELATAVQALAPATS